MKGSTIIPLVSLAVLALAIGAVAFAYRAGDAPMYAVVVGGLEDLEHGYRYASTAHRLDGLVVEPACPSILPRIRQSHAVADVCTAEGSSVVVSVRSDLDPDEVAVALQASVARELPGHTVKRREDPRELEVAPTKREEVLSVGDLEQVGVYRLDEGELTGTGPWVAECVARSLAGTTCGDRWLEPVRALEPVDVVVLRRRTPWSLPGTTRRIVYVGLAGAPAPPGPLRAMLEGHEVQAVLAPPSEWESDLRPAHGDRWVMERLDGRRVLVAVPNPSRQDAADLVGLLNRVMSIEVANQAFGIPATAPVPISLAQNWITSPPLTAGCAAELGEATILTAASRKVLGEALATALKGPCRWSVNAVDPGLESGFRGTGTYGISLVSMSLDVDLARVPEADRESLATRFLHERLGTWFPDDHPVAKAVAAAASQPGTAVNAALMDEVSKVMVPVAWVPDHAVVHDDALGWSSATQSFNPATIGRRAPDSVRGWLVVALGFSLVAASTAGYALADRRRRRFEREVDALHHDLVSPLAAVRSNLLLEPVESTSQGAALADVELVIGFVEGLRARGAGATTDLAAAAAGAVRRWKLRVPGIQISCPRVASTNIVVHLPDDLVIRMIDELVSNAVRAGGPAATVRVAAGLLAGGGVRLTVEDDGPGIPPELGGHVLEPGVRGSDSVSTGMGLANVAAWARASRGRLILDSPRGPTRFEVRWQRD